MGCEYLKKHGHPVTGTYTISFSNDNTDQVEFSKMISNHSTGHEPSVFV